MTAFNTPDTLNTPDAINTGASTPRVKSVFALFSRENADTKVIMFLLLSEKERAPMFSGSIDEKFVSAFMRQPRDTGKRPFLSFMNEKNIQVATGNVVVNEVGIPLLAMRLEGSVRTQWVSIGKGVSDDVLLMLGADPAKLHIPLAQRETTRETAAA